MAQISFAGCAGAGGHQFAVALAEASAGGLLDGDPRVPRGRGGRRDPPTGVVSRLVPALGVVGILYQPVFWPMRAAGAFHFHPHSARLDITADGQGPAATEAPIRCDDLLASGQGEQSVGPAILDFAGSSRQCLPDHGAMLVRCCIHVMSSGEYCSLSGQPIPT
jgi:hypothetical protein